VCDGLRLLLMLNRGFKWKFNFFKSASLRHSLIPDTCISIPYKKSLTLIRTNQTPLYRYLTLSTICTRIPEFQGKGSLALLREIVICSSCNKTKLLLATVDFSLRSRPHRSTGSSTPCKNPNHDCMSSYCFVEPKIGLRSKTDLFQIHANLDIWLELSLLRVETRFRETRRTC
jgi:hypothetical protein